MREMAPKQLGEEKLRVLERELVVLNEGRRRQLAIHERNDVTVCNYVEDLSGGLKDIPPETEVSWIADSTRNIVVAEV